LTKIEIKICERLYILSSSLTGLGGLFLQTNRDMPLETEEMNGIGNLLQKLAEEAQVLEDLMRSGQDPTTNERNGTD
jgi:hypothetical protein